MWFGWTSLICLATGTMRKWCWPLSLHLNTERDSASLSRERRRASFPVVLALRKCLHLHSRHCQKSVAVIFRFRTEQVTAYVSSLNLREEICIEQPPER